ncbi:MAG: hypothetical protein OXC31_22605 [Spirochaetaceae bacterium]|nr:hypothetical protein [Spirochaetaceae bacterium]
MKVPKCVAGCRFDGFDVAAWVDQGLVDLIVPGCRSLDVDVQGFVELAGGRDVPVYPCLDDHHGTDAYLNPGPELFRGVFVNWLSQGAAGAQTFNWTHASAATHARLGVRSLPSVRRQMFADFLLRRLPIENFFATTPVDELIQTLEASAHPAGNRPSVAYWRPWLPIRHGLTKSIHQPLKIPQIQGVTMHNK